jgi:hypothetical protein
MYLISVYSSTTSITYNHYGTIRMRAKRIIAFALIRIVMFVVKAIIRLDQMLEIARLTVLT